MGIVTHDDVFNKKNENKVEVKLATIAPGYTAGRPQLIFSGETLATILGSGAVLALAAFALVLTTNPPTILLSFAALVIAMLYPYAKRVISIPQAVLGLAFKAGTEPIMPLAHCAITRAGFETINMGAAITGRVID